MSGGSHEYLFVRWDTEGRVGEREVGHLRDMIRELETEFPELDLEAQQLRNLAECIEEVGKFWKDAEGVMYAVEWWASSDWGRDQVIEHCHKMRRRLCPICGGNGYLDESECEECPECGRRGQGDQ